MPRLRRGDSAAGPGQRAHAPGIHRPARLSGRRSLFPLDPRPHGRQSLARLPTTGSGRPGWALWNRVAAGVTTVGDNTDAGVTMRVLAESGLRGIVYQELFGIDDREPVEPIMEALRVKIDGAPASRERPRRRRRLAPRAVYDPARAVRGAQRLRRRGTPADQHPCCRIARRKPADGAGRGRRSPRCTPRRGITWETPAHDADALRLRRRGR